MPRNLSAFAVQKALARESTSAWLFLLIVQHPDTGETFRFVNNTEAVISEGLSYEPFPFALTLNINDEEHLPEIGLEIDNVDRALMAIVREALTPPRFNLKVVLSDTPDVVEEEIFNLVLLDVTYDAYRLTGTLILDDLLNTRWPAEVISLAAGYRGLFRQ